MDFGRIEEFNEWWFTERVSKDLLKEKKRKLFFELKRFSKKRQIVSVTGLRRTGKTTLLYQIIDFLLEEGVDNNNILYFSFDERVEKLDEVLDSYRENKGIDFRKQKVFVFLDEIQKLDEWTDQIKKMYDLYPKIKFFLSGSEGIFLSSKTKETLAGRIFELVLKPLSFREFIYFKGFDESELPQIKKKQLFLEFLKKGGFIEVLNMNEKDAKLYIISAVVDKIVFQDLTKISGIRDIDLMKTIVELAAVNPGMYLDYQSLAKQLDKDRRTIKQYITLLEQSFLIKIMKNYRKSSISTLRKIKRIYPVDTALINAYKLVQDEGFFGRVVETAVINSSSSVFFWKNSYEVDLVTDCPVEVKFKNKIISRDFAGIKACMKKFSFKKAIILTKDTEEQHKLKEGIVSLIPVWKFLLEETSEN
ncbi:ATP-binding protein [Candidatus Micrarchaeota archaeon]|nr:ATP-binding protein [Candidatus Micrarchaeota archaeon]MBU2476795.1 ATP-binding protein [Candidatus Micrarchaeota archaeon]